ncbi:MAG: hypothetical protein LBC39_06595 [Methanobrevibacter sp.]|jgi:hypothetical protein|nr:hypothetical protein [Candidatus Methanovirga aequatorialis]
MGKIGNIIKILSILFLMLVFFEAGLIGSYTIVTSEVPNIQALVDMQVQSILEIFNKKNVDRIITKDPNVYRISNVDDVADTLKNLAQVDGVNINDMNATSYQSLNGKTVDVNIEVLGYSGVNNSGGEITIKTTPDLKITASATAKPTAKKVKIDISTIKIISVMQLTYNNRR